MSDQTYHVIMAVLFVLVSGGYFLEAMRQLTSMPAARTTSAMRRFSLKSS
ncbi:hypothetical protein ABIF63_003484 [Bradyrhizobium japonicum]|uniref:Uncharacterized protein n=1 Tax=Bradyrhizobium japonicum TaxID=375 RepID=A0ABV2RR00_BRAJP|nr:hypothetical protein [Bradyrhizobium japonicum]UQD97248.1 hypothetical protein JEY30_38145 [Bradyrhizobium japonicum]WLB17366.1 hypothetical protein QIH95_36030 [Bradyrhizobium japonicum]